jgi:hypothetical protein
VAEKEGVGRDVVGVAETGAAGADAVGGKDDFGKVNLYGDAGGRGVEGGGGEDAFGEGGEGAGCWGLESQGRWGVALYAWGRCCNCRCAWIWRPEVRCCHGDSGRRRLGKKS